MSALNELDAWTCERSACELEAEIASLQHELAQRDRIWESKLDIAARIHNSMLPKPVRDSRIDLDVRHRSLEAVGGDYCQVLFPNDSLCYVTLCDVVGHGIGPAMLAARVSSHVRQLVMNSLRPNQVVSELNSFVLEHFSGTGLEYLSFFVMRIDFDQGMISYSGAGHPSGILIHPRDGTIKFLLSQNMLIGVDEQHERGFHEEARRIMAGDRLVLFTDGLVESMDPDGRLFGMPGLIQILSQKTGLAVSELADLIERRLADFRKGPAHDDMILIVAEIAADTCDKCRSKS